MVCLNSRPSNGVFRLFLNQTYALQNVSDIIDATFLLHIQHVSCLSFKLDIGTAKHIKVTGTEVSMWLSSV